MINKNEALIQMGKTIKFYIKRYNVSNQVANEDLYQVGLMAVSNAYNNFDESKGVQFKTYAQSYIKAAIIEELIAFKSGFALSRYDYTIQNTINSYLTKNPNASTDEISLSTGYSYKIVVEHLAQQNTTSLNKMTNNDDGTEIGDIIAAKIDSEIDNQDSIKIKAMLKAVSVLNEKDKDLVGYSFGITLNGKKYNKLNQNELGKMFNISHQAISKRLKSILFKLSKTLDDLR